VPWSLLFFLALALASIYQTLRIGGFEVLGPGPMGVLTHETPRTDLFPRQENYAGTLKKLPHPSVDGYEMEILARYELQGLAVSTRFYAFDPYREIMPMDVGVVFGPVMQGLQSIKFWHGNRFLKWSHSSDFQVENHWLDAMTNNHLIPSSKNQLRALRDIEAGDKVRMVGELVNVWKQNQLVFRSSLIREDREGGACEVIWLKSLQINSKIYY
jgi:hypothetical protein